MNHTQRIRKARRQGLADHGKNLGLAAHGRTSARVAGANLADEARATGRRKEWSAGGKIKRQRSQARRQSFSR